jgi:hypothetical protein
MSRKVWAATVAALLGLTLSPGWCRADITFTMNPIFTSTNAGDFTKVNATTADALNLNQNQFFGQNTPILQIVTDQNLAIQSPQGGGQSFIVAADPTKPFGDVVITPINPPLVGFTSLELNPYADPGSSTPGHFYLVATDNLGNMFTSQQFTFDSSGNNRFAAVASNGEYITRLEMVVTPPSADILKQFRLDYVAGSSTQAVPAPPTLALALSGLVAVGFVGVRRLRRPQAASV